MRKTTTGDIKNNFVNMLIYGTFGRGKTSLCRSLDREKTLVISSEKGTKVLMKENFPMWEIESWDDMDTAYKELLKGEPYENVYIDSLTDLSEHLIEKIVEVERPIVRPKLSNLYEGQMIVEDYQTYATRMKKIIRKFRNLDYNVIFTAAEESYTVDMVEKFKPLLPGKALGKELLGWFDAVFRIVLGENDVRYLLTDSSKVCDVKARTRDLKKLELIQDDVPGHTNLKEIIAKLRGLESPTLGNGK